MIRQLSKLAHFSIWNSSQKLTIKVISSWDTNMTGSSASFEFLSEFLFCLFVEEKENMYTCIFWFLWRQRQSSQAAGFFPQNQYWRECRGKRENKWEFQEHQQHLKTWKLSGDIKGCFELIYLWGWSCYNTDERFQRSM